MADEALLSVRGLHAGYGETEILRGIDLVVGAGDIVAVLGSNGAGKSTLNHDDFRAGCRAPGFDRVRRPLDPERRVRPRSSPPAWCMFRKAAAFSPIMSVAENLDLGSYRRASAQRDSEPRAGFFDVSRGCANARRNAPARCRAASSRCWRSAAA